MAKKKKKKGNQWKPRFITNHFSLIIFYYFLLLMNFAIVFAYKMTLSKFIFHHRKKKKIIKWMDDTKNWPIIIILIQIFISSKSTFIIKSCYDFQNNIYDGLPNYGNLSASSLFRQIIEQFHIVYYMQICNAIFIIIE